MKRLFADANVLLEVLLLREKLAAVRELLAMDDAEVSISPLSVHICYHYCRKEGIPPRQLEEFFGKFKILPMDELVIKLAQRRYSGEDFEDCLQAACAELGGCDQILTLDKKFARASRTRLPVHIV